MSLNIKFCFDVFCFFIAVCVLQNHAQMALASSPFSLTGILSHRRSFGISKANGSRDIRSRPIITSFDDLKSNKRTNASSMEMEIAAIFKEFAYGPKKHNKTQPTTSRSTTIENNYDEIKTFPPKPISTTKAKKFIGKQREVFSGDVEDSKYRDVVSVYLVSSTKLPEFKARERPEFTSKSNFDFLYKVDSTKPTQKDVSKEIPLEFFNDEISTEKTVSYVPYIIRSNAFTNLQLKLGKAWSFHTFSTAVIFGLVSILSALSLTRIGSCSQVLPRGYFITVHTMIILASFLRCILFFHDPYGAYKKLPSVLTNLLFNTVLPVLITAYSVVLLVLLRASKVRLVPLSLQSPLVLATICGMHIGSSVVIDVSSGVLEEQTVIYNLNVITKSVTIVWGLILCLGYVFSFSSIEKSANKHQTDLARLTLSRKVSDEINLSRILTKPYLVYAARLFLICTLLKALLIAFIILSLVNEGVPENPDSSEAWAWWTQNCLERLLEISLCVLILSSAVILTYSSVNRPKLPILKEDQIFSIFSGRKTSSIRNADIYAVSDSKRSHFCNTNPPFPENYGTAKRLSENRNTSNTLRVRNPEIMYPMLCSSSMSKNTLNSVNSLHNQNFNCNVLDTKSFNRTGSKLIPEVVSCNLIENSHHKNLHVNVGDRNSVHIDKGYYTMRDNCDNFICTKSSVVQNNSPAYYISPINCKSNLDDYEVAPYYNSNKPQSNNLYSRPYYNKFPDLSNEIYENPNFPLQTNGADFCSQNEILERFNNGLLTFSPAENVFKSSQTSQNFPEKCRSQGYYTEKNAHSSQHENRSKHVSKVEPPYCHNAFNFLKQSTTSLNEAIKGQNSLLNKFVINNSNSSSTYFPLGLDDSISIPSSDGLTKKSISTNDLFNTSTSSKRSENEGTTKDDISNRQLSHI